MNNILLPPFIMTSPKGSFARKTIEERKPQIINQVLAGNDFTPEIRQSLVDFKSELSSEIIQPLTEIASDLSVWHSDLQPYLGKTWFEIPWFFAEAYFYRRVLEMTHYFQPGPLMGLDPFEPLKHNEIYEGLSIFDEIFPSMTSQTEYEGFRAFCIKALWGNRGDLSHVDILDPSMGTQSHRIILDQTENAYRFINASKPIRIAYFFDNVGKELYFDLALIDLLIHSGLAGKVTCYVKNQPFFVSDTMSKDLLKTIDLMTISGVSEVRNLSQRLIKGIKSGTIQIEAPPFLTFSRMYRELPEVLLRQISHHDLAVLKGDVNYRRLMGDRQWPPTTPVDIAGGYFPTSFLSLRTLKAELVVGFTDDLLDKVIHEADPEWLINGKRGLITFHQK